MSDIGAALTGVAGSISSAAQSIASTISSIGDAGSEVLGGIWNGAEHIGQTVGGEITSAADQVGTIADGVYQDVGDAFSDLGNLAVASSETLANDIGSALHTTLGAVESAYTGVVAGFDHLQAQGDQLLSQVGSSLSSDLQQLGNGASDFLKEYGHTIVDIAADYVCPGSSLLVDALWDEVQNGHFPTLGQIGTDAAESLANDMLPGVDEAISGAMPGIVGDLASNELNTAVDTYISTGSLPTGQQLLEGAAGDLVSEGQDFVQDLTPQIEDALSSVIPDLTNAVQFVEDSAGTVNEIIDTAKSIQQMSQGQILALAGAGIDEITSTDDLSLDAQQALAAISSGLKFVAPVTELVDTASNILSFSQAQLQALAAAGIDVIDSSDPAQLVLSFQDVQQAAAAGVSFASAFAPVLLTESGGDLSLYTDSFLTDLAKTGVTEIVGTSSANLDVDQALALEHLGVKVGVDAGDALAIADTATNIQSLTPDAIEALGNDLVSPILAPTEATDLSLAQVDALIAARFSLDPTAGPVTIEDNAADLSNLTSSTVASMATAGLHAIDIASGSLILDLSVASDLQADGVALSSSFGVTVTGSVAEFQAATLFPGKTIDGGSAANVVEDSVQDYLAMSAQSLSTLVTANGISSLEVYDSIGDLAGLTMSELSSLSADGIVSFNVKDTLNDALSSPLTAAAIPVAIASWSLNGSNTDVSALTIGQIAQLAAEGVRTITDVAPFVLPGAIVSGGSAPTSATTLDLAQVDALESDGIRLSNPNSAGIVLTSTAAGIEQMSAADFTSLAQVGVNTVSVSDGPVALTVDQAEALTAANLTLVTANGTTATVTLPAGSFPDYPTPTALVPLTVPNPLVHIGRQLSPVQREGGPLDYQIAGGGIIFQSQLDTFQAAGLTPASEDDLSFDMIGNITSGGLIAPYMLNEADLGSNLEVTGSGSGSVRVSLYQGTDGSGDPVLVSSSQVTPVVNGQWGSIVPTGGLAPGLYTIEIDEFNASGTMLEDRRTIANGLLIAPSPTVSISSAGGTVTSAEQVISGSVSSLTVGQSLAAGTKVTLTDNGVTFGQATVAADGSWSAQVTLSDQGQNAIVASDTDAVGNTGTSSPVSFTFQANAASGSTGSTGIAAGTSGSTGPSPSPGAPSGNSGSGSSGSGASQPGTNPSPPDSVTFDQNVAFFGAGTFVLSGKVTAASGVASLDVTANVDGTVTDLGPANVNADGTFTIVDRLGKHSEGYITATAIDGSGASVSGVAPYALAAGLSSGPPATEDTYSVNGADVDWTAGLTVQGARHVSVLQPDQTIDSQYADTFRNQHQQDTTFVFSPGYADDTIRGFIAGGSGHDTLSLASSDFTDLAQVLRQTEQTSAGAVIHDVASGDTILLSGITRAQLSAHPTDITFHG